MHLAGILRKMGVMVKDINNRKIGSVRNYGSDVGVDCCAFYDTGMENLSDNDNSEENNDVNYLADGRNWYH